MLEELLLELQNREAVDDSNETARFLMECCKARMTTSQVVKVLAGMSFEEYVEVYAPYCGPVIH